MDCSPPDSSVHGNSPGKNTGVGSHVLLQSTFPTQGLNPVLLHCRWILYHLNHQGSPWILEWVAYPISRRSSRPRNWTRISCIAGRFFTSWATREAGRCYICNFSFFFLFWLFALYLFFLLFLFFLFYFIFKLYNILLVLPYIKMNPPQAYMCSPSWTLLPPPSPYHPSRSSHCTSPKHPALCIEPGLATRFIYNIIHISIPFSKIISPSPSPTESKRLLYTCNFSCIFLSGLIYFAIVSH